jgi:hypothetical protein
MYRRGFLAVAVLLTLLGAVSPSLAQGRFAQGYYYPGSGVMRLDQILPGIRSRYPGRFYDAEGPYPDGMGGYNYRIKWMTPDGRIMWLDADARTGRVGPARNNWRQGGPPAPPPPMTYGMPYRYGPPAGGQFGYGVRPGGRFPGGGFRGGWGGRGRPHG